MRTVLIFGGGPAGLLFTQYLRNALGFDGQIVVSEPNALKRGFAERYGAIAVDPTAVDLREAIAELTAAGASSTPSTHLAPAPSSLSCPRCSANRARSCSTGMGTPAWT